MTMVTSSNFRQGSGIEGILHLQAFVACKAEINEPTHLPVSDSLPSSSS